VARRDALRASDADREAVAERLRHATAEGRLLAEELEDRLGTVFGARTYGELESAIVDLPGPRQRRGPVARQWLGPAVALAIALVALAMVVAVMLVFAGLLLAGWAVWLIVGWLLLGRGRVHHHHHHHHRGQYRRSAPGSGRWYA